MRKMFFALLTASTLILTFNSCKESSESVLQEQNESTVAVKNNMLARTTSMQKSDFNDLSTLDKIRVWDNKLEQVLTENLTNQQRVLVENIRIELPKVALENYDGIALAEYGLEMAKITPENEFVRMFAMLENYERDNSQYSGVLNNENIISDMNIFLQEVQENKALYAKEKISLKSCNCKWTCGWYAGNHDNCEKTTSGCGFLWMSACTGAII